jgi:hypothetical protein
MHLRQVFATNLLGSGMRGSCSQGQLAHDAEVDRAYMSRVERAVTYVGLEIIGNPMLFWRDPSRWRATP